MNEWTNWSATLFLLGLGLLNPLGLLLHLAFTLFLHHLVRHRRKQVRHVLPFLGTHQLKQGPDLARILFGQLILYLFLIISIDFVTDNCQHYNKHKVTDIFRPVFLQLLDPSFHDLKRSHGCNVIHTKRDLRLTIIDRSDRLVLLLPRSVPNLY